MRVLITGANGFVGKNLQLHLSERIDVEVLCFTRGHTQADLLQLVTDTDLVFHLAGINRPQDPAEFQQGNADLTHGLYDALEEAGKVVPIIYSSSTQASADNPYGVSKRAAENALLSFSERSGSPVFIYRLPNVFGKWARPNYNSAVATFCHNIARDLPVQINDPAAVIRLVYVDDVVASFKGVLGDERPEGPFVNVPVEYQITV